MSITIRKGETSQLNAIRTQDIKTDSDSVAFQALNSVALNPEAERMRRPSIFANFLHRGQEERDSEEEEGEEAMEGHAKKVEGREIRQDHSLYALTYGMMLGIRVMVRETLFAYLFVQPFNIFI